MPLFFWIFGEDVSRKEDAFSFQSGSSGIADGLAGLLGRHLVGFARLKEFVGNLGHDLALLLGPDYSGQNLLVVPGEPDGSIVG